MSAQPVANVLPIVKPNASFVNVTPEVAARWLTFNKRNRKIRKADLNRYVRDMHSGRWHLDGSPIRFAADGALLDGQHRLTAIVETGVTLPLLVVRGLAEETQNVMDTGRRRTAADQLDIAKHRNSTCLAAVARLSILVEHDQHDGRVEVSHGEILASIDANPDMESAVDFAMQFARKTDCPPAVVAYTYMILRRIDEKDAAEFWVGVSEKVGLRDGDPILALANRFAEARRNRERLTRRTQISLVYRAWNTRRKGKTMRFIRVNSPSGGLVPVPEPI